MLITEDMGIMFYIL